MEIHCLRCKGKTEANEVKSVTLKNGREAQQGVCSVCGAKVFRMGKAS